MFRSSPVQALDPVDFELRFKKKLDDSKAIEPVPLRERSYIITTYTISSLGLGLGCTIGPLLKFVAPLAIGGAGLKIATLVMAGLVGGAGLLAVALAFVVHKRYTKEAIEKAGKQLKQISDNNDELAKRSLMIDECLYQAFSMLLYMKYASEKLKRARLLLDPASSPSPTEDMIEKRINNYINFLVIDPNHPHLQQIKDDERRRKSIGNATDRQETIRDRLMEACDQLLKGKTTVKNYQDTHIVEIRDCFPSLRLTASRAKTPTVMNKPAIGFSFLGTFSGVMGLSYTAITLISLFTTMTITFPPLYPILALSFTVATITAYTAYKAKKEEAIRMAQISNQEKQLAYYTEVQQSLKDQYTKELQHYAKYQPEVLRNNKTLSRSKSMSELKRVPSVRNGLSLFNETANFDPTSNHDIPSLERIADTLPEEDLTFEDPSEVKEQGGYYPYFASRY